MSSCQGIAYREGIWITLLLLVASNPRDLIVVTKTADTVKNTNIRFPKQKKFFGQTSSYKGCTHFDKLLIKYSKNASH